VTEQQLTLRVNGDEVVVDDVATDARLLDVLRDRLGLRGTKEACGRGECGACTVMVDGRAVLSCITYARRARGAIETVEGVEAESEPLRRAFAQCGAFQCGFCTPGQIVRGVSLLREGLPDDDARLRAQMSGNVCRCTGYSGIIAALRDAEANDGKGRS
jgi:aerobic-type carbon monoxide dehydrogenase small subunit (CoxS/CutS family)